MYKLTFVLLLATATQPAAFGKRLNREAFDRPGCSVLKLTPPLNIYGYEFATAATKLNGYALPTKVRAPSTALSNRHSERRTGGTIIPKLERTPARRVLPASGAGILKTGDKARRMAWKNAAWEDEARSVRATSKGGAKRAHGSRAPAMVTFPSGVSLRIVKGPVGKGQEHYDPTGSRNPLLDTSGRNRSRMLSDNFSVGELAHSGNVSTDKSRIDPRLVICLQDIRDLVGKPVWIRSGYRSFWHNLEVYGERHEKPTDSQHIAGKASDIKVDGMSGLELSKVAIDACGPNVAIGVGLEYAHVDVRGVFRAWIYKGVPPRQLAEVKQYRAESIVAQRGRTQRTRRVSFLKRAHALQNQNQQQAG